MFSTGFITAEGKTYEWGVCHTKECAPDHINGGHVEWAAAVSTDGTVYKRAFNCKWEDIKDETADALLEALIDRFEEDGE